MPTRPAFGVGSVATLLVFVHNELKVMAKAKVEKEVARWVLSVSNGKNQLQRMHVIKVTSVHRSGPRLSMKTNFVARLSWIVVPQIT